jgi:hypothetical protein
VILGVVGDVLPAPFLSTARKDDGRRHAGELAGDVDGAAFSSETLHGEIELAQAIPERHACHPTVVRIAILAVLVLLLAPSAPALPVSGLVVEGRGLGGVRLGVRSQAVTRKWGRTHGVCRSCRFRTWYFNYVRYKLRDGARRRALRTGDPEGRVTELYPG